MLPAVALLAVLLLGASADPTSDPFRKPEIERLFKWVEDLGGQLGVYSGVNAQGFRGLFASRDYREGEEIARIPATTIMNIGGEASSFAYGTLYVLRELTEPHSRFGPYLASWPQPHEVLSVCNFPEEYVPMFESDYWEQYVRSSKDEMVGLLEGKYDRHLEYTLAEMVGNANVTVQDLQYACTIATTRATSVSSRGRTNMVPIYDLLNHADDCPQYVEYDDDKWFTMVASPRGVKKGEELCYGYSHGPMRMDYGVAIYGFLPPPSSPPQLAYVDHHEFNAKDSSSFLQIATEPIKGPPSALEAEAQRLQAILEGLGPLPDQPGVDPRAGPAPEAEDPQRRWVGDMMRRLQLYRRIALQYWVAEYRRLAAAGGNMPPPAPAPSADAGSAGEEQVEPQASSSRDEL